MIPTNLDMPLLQGMGSTQYLVGGWTYPFFNISPIGSFLQVGVNIKKHWKPSPRYNFSFQEGTLPPFHNLVHLSHSSLQRSQSRYAWQPKFRQAKKSLEDIFGNLFECLKQTSTNGGWVPMYISDISNIISAMPQGICSSIDRPIVIHFHKKKHYWDVHGTLKIDCKPYISRS